MSIFKHDAIRKAHPEAITIRGEDAFDINDNPIILDETKVAEEVKRLQADYDFKAYARSRVSQYPSINDVVVALAEKEEGDDTMWKEITALRQKVKSENPKPE
tara:strand:+ start:2142 stop:2450 length:309 start_codon:yes stop_codon:yes gene_type:complete